MPQLINLENQEFMASENVGHTLALKDEHIKKITDAYEKFMQSVKPVEQMPQTEELVKEEVKVESPQLDSNLGTDLGVNIMDQNNAPAPSFGQGQTINEQPVSFNETNNIELGTLNETPNVATQAPLETNVFEQPTILEQPGVQPAEQPVSITPTPEPVQNVEVTNQMPLNSTISEIDEMKNNIISLMDRLKEKENELKRREDIVKEKEANVDAKLTVANQAWENAQAVNNTMVNQPDVQMQTDTQNRTLVA